MPPDQERSGRRFHRPSMLRELADRPFDVLVVGAGLAGAGVALDAASRGLRTALVDATDFGSGASSHTTKLVHGGLRHLRRGDLRQVAAAFAERRRLLDNAAHLVEPLPFVMPFAPGSDGVNLRFVRAVDTLLWAYDIAGARRHGAHRRIDAPDLETMLPVLGNTEGGFVLSNGVVDDSRLVLSLARTACLDHQATVANHTSVVGLHKDRSGAVAGAVVRTAEGDEFEVTTRAVVNAAGVGSGAVRALDDMRPAPEPDVVRVTHVAIPADLMPIEAATVLPGDHPLVLVPWGRVVLAGPVAFRPGTGEPGDDADRLVAAIRARTTVAPTVDDVTAVTTGVRPRIRPTQRRAVDRSPSGLVSVSGATLTSFRLLAADAVDAVIEQFADDLDRWVVRRCRTADLPLRGSAGHSDVATPVGMAGPTAARLIRRHGGEAGAVMAMADTDTTPLVEGLPHLAVEAVWAARHEMALTVDDVLSRRVRARLVDEAATADAAGPTAALLGGELGWSAQRIRSEATTFTDGFATGSPRRAGAVAAS